MRFRHAFIVSAPFEQVAAFHRDPIALARLTPPPLSIRWIHREPVAEGARARFILQWGPVAIPWEAIHREVSATGFVDEQVKGPFRRWVHRHRFREITPGVTEIIDEIEAALPRHPLRALVALAIWLGLPLLFAYRARATRRALQTASQ
jgi:ligand-binding SRPBCC domain-containing protein